MRGIIKSNHKKLRELLQNIHTSPSFSENKLSENERELNALFQNYEEKMYELKNVIALYHEKEKLIKNEIRRYRKNNSNYIISEKQQLVPVT